MNPKSSLRAQTKVLALALLLTIPSLLSFPLPTQPTALAVAKDGWIAYGDGKGDVRVYNAQRKLVSAFRERGPVFSLAFSPTGDRIATGFQDDGRNTTVAIWSRSGKLIQYFDSEMHQPPRTDDPMRGYSFVTTYALAWSPDGKTIAAEHGGHLNTGVQLWTSDGKSIIRFGEKTVPGQRPWMAAGVKAVRFSPSGRFLVAAMDDGYVRVWRTDGKPVWETQVIKDEGVTDADFSQDGKYVFFAAGNLWGRLTASTGKRVDRVVEKASCIAVRNAGAKGATVIFGRSLRQSGKRAFDLPRTITFISANGPGHPVALATDHKRIYTGSLDPDR